MTATMTKDAIERFAKSIIISDGCWIFVGPTGTRGLTYGSFRNEHGKIEEAHRFSYRLLRGEIPSEFEIDHLCTNHPCVNPWHLEPVTWQENLQRAQYIYSCEHKTRANMRCIPCEDKRRHAHALRVLLIKMQSRERLDRQLIMDRATIPFRR